MRNTRTLVALCILAAASPIVSRAAAKLGPASWVVDVRLAALRSDGECSASLVKRLRCGRMVVVLGQKRDADGRLWVRVAVTRRTRGWMLAEAIARPGDHVGERRLLERLAAETGFDRIALARLAFDRFPRLRGAAADALDAEADRAAAALTQRVRKRLGDDARRSGAEVRTLMLSDSLLDRYNRLGMTFDVDKESLDFVPIRRWRSDVDSRPKPRANVGGAFSVPDAYAMLARSLKGARIERCKQLSWQVEKVPG